MPGTLQNEYSTIDIIIANAASLSGAANLGDLRVCGIIMPAAWTAASLTFQASADDATYNNLHQSSDGAEFTIVASTSRFIAIDPTYFLGVGYLKVRSGTSGAAVNQGASRTLTLIARRL